MTQPSEEEVRAGIAWIKSLTLLHEDTVIRPASMSYVKPSEYRRWVELRLDDVLALLDAGRKDRERLDWIEAQDRAVEIGPWEWSPVYDTISLRAAIDKARGA